MRGMRREVIRWMAARAIAAPAFVMPYRMRLAYIGAIAAIVHAPLRAFGRLARYLLAQLDIRAETPVRTAPGSAPARPALGERGGAIAILFSGGTDSMCAAALLAEECDEMHLLTFYEHATRRSPEPKGNVETLAKHFPRVRFKQKTLSVDKLVRFLWYERPLATVRAHGLLALATCGFSSLSWHIRAIAHCREHGITRVADGLTRELMHFPGHMDAVVEMFRALYAHYGILYENPVREWPVPPDQQLIDKVLVNPHAEYVPGSEVPGTTTGWYLFEKGLMPRPNMKGSPEDFAMQHECYPFALYNIIALWGYLSVEPYASFEARVAAIMNDKMAAARALLDDDRRCATLLEE